MKPQSGRKALGTLLRSAANTALVFCGLAFLVGVAIGVGIMLALR